MATPKLTIPLFLTRLSIFYFMLPWQVSRFLNPEVTAGIAAKHYKISGIPDVAATLIAVFMMVLIIAFVCGFKKRISYGLVFLMHGLGTLMTVPRLIPWTENFAQLFLAAIPTVAAMYLLYLLRDQDTLLTVDRPTSM